MFRYYYVVKYLKIDDKISQLFYGIDEI